MPLLGGWAKFVGIAGHASAINSKNPTGFDMLLPVGFGFEKMRNCQSPFKPGLVLGLSRQDLQGVEVGAQALVEDVEVGMVAAIPTPAGTTGHVGGVTQVAFEADHLAQPDSIAGLDFVDAVQQGDGVILVFDQQGGVAVLVYVKIRDDPVDGRFYLGAFTGGQVDGHVAIGKSVETLGNGVMIVRGGNSRLIQRFPIFIFDRQGVSQHDWHDQLMGDRRGLPGPSILDEVEPHEEQKDQGDKRERVRAGIPA